MNFWNRPVRTFFHDAEDLSGTPGGGRGAMWVCGVGLALIPALYGAFCIVVRKAALFGSRGSPLELRGNDAVWLGAAYISVGVFAHFHWFWGLHPRRQPYVDLGKLIALLVFLPSMGHVIYRIFAELF